jgi:subtilase family serine protease
LKKYLTTTACSFLMLVALTFFTWGSTAFAAAPTATRPTRLTFSHACSAVPQGFARCSALIATLVSTSKALTVSPFADPTGGSAPYDPANLHSAYNLPTTASGTPTVGIVDAFNDPDLSSDLATYRSEWGLSSCTTSNGCLKIASQTGSTTKLPSTNESWGVEESLDLDMVSAICENCHIVLVEASSASNANLGAAANEAVKLGAIAVSNSYGESEFSGEASDCSSFYQHNDVAVTASTGDGGPGVEYPSVCPTVIGVGGTTLNSNGTETAWNTSSTEGSGGGCSSFIAIPTWQSSSVTGCSKRAVADVSADADPNTGVFVFDSFGEGGWLEVGGTSESSPIIASVFALAGNVSTTTTPATLPWAHRSSLFEVGGTSYAFQTGLGSPNGTGAF